MARAWIYYKPRKRATRTYNKITMTKYYIKAECTQYSEWEVDENGKPTIHNHDFEGVDVATPNSYKVIDEYGEYIEEGITFKRAQELVDELSDPNAIS